MSFLHCVSTPGPTLKGKKVQVRMQAVRYSDAYTSSQSQGKVENVKDAMMFIFCTEQADVKKEETTENDTCSVAGVQLPPFQLANLCLLLPAAVAAHGGGFSLPAGVACACLPIMSPFRVPQVSPDSWMANKRALAFHRCCVFGVYVQ